MAALAHRKKKTAPKHTKPPLPVAPSSRRSPPAFARFALRWSLSLRSGPLLNEGQDVVRRCGARIRQLAASGGSDRIGVRIQNNHRRNTLLNRIAIAIRHI